jgi:hypothetical protein
MHRDLFAIPVRTTDLGDGTKVSSRDYPGHVTLAAGGNP